MGYRQKLRGGTAKHIGEMNRSDVHMVPVDQSIYLCSDDCINNENKRYWIDFFLLGFICSIGCLIAFYYNYYRKNFGAISLIISNDSFRLVQYCIGENLYLDQWK